MLEPADVPRVLIDAARLLGRGEIALFGSGALYFWVQNAPRSRDVDLRALQAREGSGSKP